MMQILVGDSDKFPIARQKEQEKNTQVEGQQQAKCQAAPCEVFLYLEKPRGCTNCALDLSWHLFFYHFEFFFRKEIHEQILNGP